MFCNDGKRSERQIKRYENIALKVCAAHMVNLTDMDFDWTGNLLAP